MRLLLGIAMLAGCGRIGIEPTATADGALTSDASPDAPPPACAVEGDACDDQNICTVTSTCTSGACVSSEPTTCTAARSEQEFAQVQGADGWYYGSWLLDGDASGTYEPSEFQEMAWLGSGWRPPSWEAQPSPNFTWAYLMAWGGHPATYPDVRATIRRWVSDVAGLATVEVHLSKADTNNGDGVRGILVVDGVVKLDRAVAFDDGVGFTESVPVELVVGSTVDWLLHPVGDDGGDTSDQWFNVVAR